MKQLNESENRQDLTALYGTIRELVEHNEYQKGEALIKEAIRKHPHAPEGIDRRNAPKPIALYHLMVFPAVI